MISPLSPGTKSALTRSKTKSSRAWVTSGKRSGLFWKLPGFESYHQWLGAINGSSPNVHNWKHVD